jgi:hypothetical protein
MTDSTAQQRELPRKLITKKSRTELKTGTKVRIIKDFVE